MHCLTISPRSTLLRSLSCLSKQSKGLAPLRLDRSNSKRYVNTSASQPSRLDKLDATLAELDNIVVDGCKIYQRFPPWFGTPVRFALRKAPPLDLFGFSMHSFFFKYFIARPSGIDLSRKAITEGSSVAFNAIAAAIRAQNTDVLGQYAYPHIVEMFNRFWTESKARHLDVIIEPTLREVVVRNMYLIMHDPLVEASRFPSWMAHARPARDLLTNDPTFRLDPNTAYNPGPAEVRRLLDAPTATTIVPNTAPVTNTMFALNALLANGATIRQGRLHLQDEGHAEIAPPQIVSILAKAFSRDEIRYQANLVLKVEFRSLDRYSVYNTATDKSILDPAQIDHSHCWEFMMPLVPHESQWLPQAGVPRWRLWDINGSNAYLLKDQSTPLHVQKEILRMRSTLDPFFYQYSNELDGNKHTQHQIEHKFFLDAAKEHANSGAATATATAADAKNAAKDDK